jgi:hypothetical protein
MLATVLVFAGCRTVHDVVVDAISNQAKPLGSSYRLDVHDPSGGVDKELGVEAVSLMRDALAARGLYEAPAGVRPDMVIELEYGVGPGEIKIEHVPSPVMMTDASFPGPAGSDYGDKPVIVFEKFIKLSAREPAPPDARADHGKARGDELWNLHVSVEDKKKELGPYLPVLASVSVDYIGENSGQEKHLQVKESDAAVALRQMQAKAATPH